MSIPSQLQKILLTVNFSVLLLSTGSPGLAEQTTGSYQQLHNRALSLIKQGKPREALSLELKAAELKPAEPAAHESLSAIYATLGDNVKALAEARKVVELRPLDELAHYNLALSLLALGYAKEALSEFRKAISPGDRGLQARIGEAQCLLRLGLITEAIRNLESLSKQFPGRKEVWLNLSYAYLAYEDRHGALLAATTANSLDPSYAAPLRLRSVLEFGSFQYQTAFGLARRSVELEPKDPAGYKLAGKIAACCAWDGSVGAAWLLDEALKNIPTSTGTFMLLGRSYRLPAEAPRHPRYRLGPEQKLKWWYMSERALKQAVKIAPNQADTNLALAQLFVERRLVHEALPYARRALELSNHSADAKATYDKAKLADNDLAGQVRLLLRSLIN